MAKSSFIELFRDRSEYESFIEGITSDDGHGLCAFFDGSSYPDVFYHCVEVEVASKDNITAEIYQCKLIKTNTHEEIDTGVTDWFVSEGEKYASIDNTGLLTIFPSAENARVVVRGFWGASAAQKEIYVTYGNPLPPILVIGGAQTVTAETCQYVAMYGGVEPVEAVWTITNGDTYASIDTGGTVTINSNASGSSVTIQAVYSGITTKTNVVLTYKSGSTSETTTEYEKDPETGEITATTTTVTENEDGTSTSAITTIVYDEEWNPEEKTNQNVDVSGNVNTQNIEYDENGNEVVTGYDIDTSGNPEGSKNYNHDGVNTEFYALDVTEGFTMDIHFTIDFDQQPPNQNDGHHNIINSKRATPEPWYGFQIRQSQTNKYIQLGTQFSTGSNLNQTITTTNANKYNGSSNIYEYNIHIMYDPTASSNKFTCDELIGNAYHYTANNTFPDIEDLKYIKTTIGCALDENGDPFRFSNINVFSFSISKLKKVATPEISCTDNHVTIICETVGATIYYRLNQVGTYVEYTEPIEITADTVVQAYGELSGDKSNIATENCIYDNGIATPVITCDGEYVSIACATTDADLYYRMNETGDFSAYTDSFTITATTVVEAYAQVGAESGHTAKETCTYAPVVLVAPVIICNGEQIFISCETTAATINYRLNQEGTYEEYTAPITITADTFVEAYSTFRGRVSSVVSQNCEYSPVHHYENDYLTFRVLTNGKIYLHSNGGVAKTIGYSLNGGSWSSITASDSSTYIDVSTDDVVRFKGENASYGTSKSGYTGFGLGEHGTQGQGDYDTDAAEVNIEGNIMSLVYGDNFVGQTAFNGGTYNFCSIFKKLKVISAENLVLPALILTEYCYRAMFSWCTYLTEAPQLPATTLAKGVYWYMYWLYKP